jgi:hypothetical protein
MWFKVEDKRTSIGQKFLVRCTSEIAGKSVLEERPAQGTAAARKAAEVLATSLNITVTVYGVHEVSEGAASATSPVIRRLFAESAAASLALKQRILDLYLDRFDVRDDLTRRRLQQALGRELGQLHLVPAHIEEFVKAGVKRARLARRVPEFSDFEPGIEATRSIANAKPAAWAGRAAIPWEPPRRARDGPAAAGRCPETACAETRHNRETCRAGTFRRRRS